MVTRRWAADESPDPLLLTDTLSSPTEIIAERPHQPSPPTKRSRANTRTAYKSPVSSPTRATLTPAKPPTQSRTRTPLSKAPLNKPTPGRGDRTPGKAEVVNTLGASVKAALPTPSRSRATSNAKTLASVTGKGKGKEKETPIRTPVKRKVEDVFDESPIASPNISRDSFLANEALKRQREARNFEYDGDAHAPRLTRSGRVVGDSRDEDADTGTVVDLGVDRYAYGVITPYPILTTDDEIRKWGPDAAIEDDGRYDPPAVSEEEASKRYSLSDVARHHLVEVLSTLTSQNVSSDPAPFQDEDKNESLQGLLKLLQGTVDRGEGNSALVTGPRGVGKTRTVARAIKLLSSETVKTAPIVVKLSGHVQTNDRLAIREMGRQIAVAEGVKPVEEEGHDEEAADGDAEEYAPTTLPSHLLALLTAPSARAIIIVIEEFDLFTEHARQALLYCLLDVVQSIKTGPVESTGRGVAVIGVTSRVDTLLLLEKRVKSRFSHRQWRITSPLSPESIGWSALLRQTLVPWTSTKADKESKEDKKWKGDWEYAVDTLLDHTKIKKALDRLCGLTTDVRNIYKPFVVPISEILGQRLDFMSIPQLAENILVQIELAGWGTNSAKLKGLPHPALAILIISKHMYYAGRETINFAQAFEEYNRFSRTKLVGIGKIRWTRKVLNKSFDHLIRVSILTPSSNSTMSTGYSNFRCTLSPHEIVAWFKGEGGNMLGPELTTWGRTMGGHA